MSKYLMYDEIDAVESFLLGKNLNQLLQEVPKVRSRSQRALSRHENLVMVKIAGVYGFTNLKAYNKYRNTSIAE